MDKAKGFYRFSTPVSRKFSRRPLQEKTANLMGLAVFHSFVHRDVRQPVGILVLFAGNVGEFHFSSPIRNGFADVGVDGFERFVLHFVISGKLFDDELGIGTELDFGGSELDRTFDSEIRPHVFSHVVGGFSEVLVPLFDGVSFGIGDVDSETCRSGISTGSAVGIHDEFHGIIPSSILRRTRFR